jgi:hypothetical protein
MLTMKNKSLIIIVALLAVFICLTISVMLIYSVRPSLLIILTLGIGVVTGILSTLIIQNVTNILKNGRSEGDV